VNVGSDSEHEIWLDLFLDLIYIATFSNIAHVVMKCGVDDYSMFLWAGCIFTAIFNSRFLIDEYANIFFVNDYYHRVFYYFYCVGLFLMAFNVYTYDYETEYSDNESGHRRLLSDDLFVDPNCLRYDNHFENEFSIGFVITRLSVLFMYIRASLRDKKCKEQFQVIVFILIFSVTLIVVKVAMNNESKSSGTWSFFFTAVLVESTGRFVQPLFYRLCLWFKSRFLSYVPVYRYILPFLLKATPLSLFFLLLSVKVFTIPWMSTNCKTA
jgi:hypothetical protein